MMQLSDHNKKEQGLNLPCSFNIKGRRKILSTGKKGPPSSLSWDDGGFNLFSLYVEREQST
jgi:hypothetical protein